ncbi:hypothetical protein SAMN05421819_1157 [Bryocella elongata]|uniref:Adenylate cyclase n=1 Tax=Bryocella elongata TaxID=863522 RepID=A0A1H5URV8_9BACT|nr:hypothetical protein SAMN05421819_1157 [Bryocella elongata]
MLTSPINPPETSFRPSRSEWERLLHRVVDSTPFRRSMRLREFLIYVGNEVVLHGAEDLPEQQIGIAVFGRPPSYDTSQDNIVRVNAMELRKRIDLYFTSEGVEEPLVFEIPRGSYIPVFRIRQANPPEPSVDQTAPSEEFLPDSRPSTLEPPAAVPVTVVPRLQVLRHPLTLSLLILSVCLAIWAGIGERRNHQAQASLHKWQSQPALRAFWGNFFGRGLAPEIVIADNSFLFAQDILHRKLSLAEYLDYSYRSAQSPDPLSIDARSQQQKDLTAIFKHSSGSVGDFRVARRITELETGDEGTRLLFAREYAGHRLRWNNTIFVGSSRSNPWVELYEDRLAYHFKEAQDSSPSLVIVDNPHGNEQPQYELSSIPGARTAYCIIVFVPNPTNTGNALILAGSDSQATEAGGDFLTSEDNLEKLQAIFRQKTFPHFQLLLRISSFNGTPLGSEIISYRIVKG